MNHQTRTNILTAVISGAVFLSFPAAVFADDAAAKVDSEAAIRLARKDKCLRCHDVNKHKEGPSYKSVADKYRGDSGAVDKILKHITEGKDVAMFSDGHAEIHKQLKKYDPDQLKNMVNWILAQ